MLIHARLGGAYKNKTGQRCFWKVLLSCAHFQLLQRVDVVGISAMSGLCQVALAGHLGSERHAL